MKVPIKIKKEKKCPHKNLFHKMSYNQNKNEEGLVGLDMKNPNIETICADCGLYLKIVKVKFFN